MSACPRCHRLCTVADSNPYLGDVYECYHCKVLDKPLRWIWDSSRLWEDTELELMNRFEFVQVIIGEVYDP